MSLSHMMTTMRAVCLIRDGLVEVEAEELAEDTGPFDEVRRSIDRLFTAARARADQEWRDVGPRVPNAELLASTCETFINDVFWLHGLERPKPPAG